MRILAIRGNNLASLAGDFEIDLAAGPLSQVGLYAITGPTGAGKSTLLDALCLALFNKTPRLANQGGVAIGAEGEAGLKDTDPRSLLRRGAISGFAEVDFLGADGRRYRARWSVRRARQKADGAIQDEDRMLACLDDPSYLAAGKKTEVSDAIAAKLGLTFEQFKQSVLLAQGDFAAFLKADGRERAQLLERMTGTEIYGRLSVRAAQKAQDAEQAVAAHREAMAGFQPMSPEERAALEASLAELEAKAAAQDALVKELEAGQRWYADLAARREKAAAAEAEAAAAQAAWDAAQPRRAELEAVRTAQPLRVEVGAADAATETLRTQEAALAELEAAFGKAQEDETQKAETLARAESNLSAAQESLRSAAPDIDRAKVLDIQVREAAEAERKQAEAAKALDAGATAAEKQARALEQALAASRGRHQDAQAWLDRHPEIGPLAGEWGRWQQELQRCASAHAEAARAKQERPGLEQAVAAAGQNAVGAKAAAEAQELAVIQAKELADQAARAAADFDPESLARDRSALDAHRDRLVALEGLRVVGDLAYRQAVVERQAEAALRAEVQQAEAAIAQAQSRRAPLVATLEEAEHTARNLAAARDLTDHRANLAEGEPCPLCGATEHPWVQGAAPLDDLAARQEARVKELRDALTELEASLKANAEKARRAATEASSAAAKAAQHEAEAARHQAAWLNQSAAIDQAWPEAISGSAGATPAGAREGSPSGLPQALHDPAAAPRLAELQAAAKAAADSLHARQNQAQQAEKAAKQAAQAYQEALARAAEATRQASLAEKAQGTAASTLQELDRRLAEAEKKRAEAEDALAGAFPGKESWRSDLAADPEAFARWCRSQVEAWTGQVQDRDRAGAEIADLTPRHAAAEASASAKREEATKAAGDAAQAAQDLIAKKTARSRLLGGQETAVYEAALQEAVAKAAEARQEAASQREAAGKALASAYAGALHARQSVLAATKQAGAAAEALAKALEATGTDLPTLRTRLARDKAWIATEEKALEGMSTRLTQTKQSLVLLTAQRQEHEQAGQPRLPEAEIGPALDAARAGHAQTQKQANTADAHLKADDQNREQAARSAEVLANLQAKAQLWSALAAVIGSKDGNKFRRFAQSLTLDALLALANEHLQQLAPRYRLMRVPHASRDTHALELQVVDLDMGDEIRSTNTLSGGESFLVSLALALGLSSLAARNTKIDSLFIDEGFGTLDPATLEVALATLDALQAEGRQVGLISHVPGLGDRIGAQVKVEPRGTGRSTVEVVTQPSTYFAASGVGT